MSGISPKLPLNLSEDGAYDLIKTYANMIKQNFKTLLLTIPGERVMDPLFGVGLHKFLFENVSQSYFLEIEDKIRNQVSKYLPIIEVLSVFFDDNTEIYENILYDSNSVFIRIEYKIIPIDYKDYIEV